MHSISPVESEIQSSYHLSTGKVACKLLDLVGLATARAGYSEKACARLGGRSENQFEQSPTFDKLVELSRRFQYAVENPAKFLAIGKPRSGSFLYMLKRVGSETKRVPSVRHADSPLLGSLVSLGLAVMVGGMS